MAGRCWLALQQKAAPLLRGSTQGRGLFLTREGQLLSPKALGAIATKQLERAGLPGLTARSVRGLQEAEGGGREGQHLA